MSNSTAPATSTIILSAASEHFVKNAPVTIAPWILGASFDLFLQGILFVQTTNYFYNRDPENEEVSMRRLSWLVILITALCLVKSTQNIANVWELTIANFCNPDAAAALQVSEWKHYTTSLSTAIIATIVQGFFVYRYWKLTRRWYVCVVMILGMLLSIVAACLVVASLAVPRDMSGGGGAMPAPGEIPAGGPPASSGPLNVSTWSLVHFVSAIIVDTLITVATAFHLHSQKSLVARSTSEMLSRLIRMVWQSALPPTICVIANATLLQIHTTQNTHIAFNMVLCKLYTISLLYTLNLRREIRSERGTSHGISILSPAYRSGGATYPGGSSTPLVDFTNSKIHTTSKGGIGA